MKPKFLFPAHPSPNMKITPQMLDSHEAKGAWIAQRKFNGAHCVIWIFQDQVQMWNRQGEPFGTYQMTEGMKKNLLYGLDRDYDTEYVLNGELLHNKAKLATSGRQAVENVVVLFDVLYAGKYLTNMTTLERMDLLSEIALASELEPKKRALKVCENFESQLWLAETFYDDFSYRFWELYEHNDNGDDLYPEIEGLMLKMKDAKNTSIGNKPNDVLWMIRCRKTKEKMYQF